MSSKTPAKIGKYDVTGILGRGGMGIVYKATDPFLDRLVAIKMMTSGYSDNPDLLKRFFREAQSTGSLQHPNIVTVYELGDHGGNPYLVMEYLEGESLDSIITSHKQLSLLEKINLIIEVCQGLGYAHQRGIVHRDIKPANIMVSKDGAVKIVDFGIAHLGDKNVTRTGQIMGSVSYMAPEQLNGKPVDPRTDIFAAGVVLYQLITYTAPFDGDSTAATLLKILHEPPPPLKNFLPAYPPELDTILLKALSKNREDRYFSADDFALDLGQLQGQLKQELVGKHLQEASSLLEKADLYKAKDQLLQVLKIDRQNTQANLLLREIQQRIQREELSEQVRQLRAQAEEAFAQEHFEAALEHLERALSLDRGNVELQRLRESIDTAWSRARKLQETLKRAEFAHQEGDFDYAKQAVEEALELAPGDAQVKALHRTIQREWTERSRQRQVENYLDQARREIAARNFTSALEILKHADSLDPNAPQVRVLIESATAGRELEQRRRELEAIARQIEEALNRDDFVGACQTAEQGLERFPDERNLLKLKALAQKQRQIAERKQFVDEQLAHARTLLEQGRSEELLSALEAALAKTGPEPRLESLLLIVRENVQRERTERRKAEYLQKAKDALRQKSYDQAIQILQTARTELNDANEIVDLLQFAKEEAVAEKRRQIVEAAAHQANDLIAQQEYEQAIKLLETTLQEVPDEELRIILAEARRSSFEYQKKLETTIGTTEKLLQARKAGDALRLLESHASLFTRSPAFQKLLETARAESERLRKIDEIISRATQALEREDYTAARTLLQEGCQLHGSSPELERHLKEVGARQSLAAERVVKKVLSDAQVLAMATQYQAALDKLASASDLLSVVSPAVKSDCEALQKQAAHGLVRQRAAQIEHYITAGELSQAAELLRQSLGQFPGSRELLDIENVLREETQRVADAQQTVAEAQKLSSKREWKAAGELLRKAFSIGQRSPAVREQVIAGLIGAAESAVEADWRVSEALLKQLAELQPDYTQPPSLQSRISRRKREETVTQCVEQAKQFQAAGDLQAALREVARGLAEHRDESRLLNLRKEIQEQIYQEEEKARAERARQEKDAFVQAVTQRAEREPELEKRIRILEEALTKYPQERQLQQQLSEARGLAERVTAIVNEARALEGARKYPDAIRQWNLLRTVHAEYPGLDSNVVRVTQLNEQARAAAEAAWIQRIQSVLSSADYDGVADLLTRAKEEFPDSRELLQLEKKLQDVLKLRAKAQKMIAEGHAALSSQQWGKAADCLRRASDVAGPDSVVREQVLSELLEGCETAANMDWQAAEMLLARAAELEPASPLLSPLRNRIENQKREQNIERFLTTAVRAQSSGDLQGAVRELERGLSEYPGESRLTQVKNDVETRLRQLEKERQRQHEAEKERARQSELERQRQIELKRQQELEREKARAAEQEQKRARARELEEKREQERTRQEEERKRQAERKRLEEERKLKDEAEKKRREEAEKQAEEARRRRMEAEKLRAAEEASRRDEDLRRTSFRGTKVPERQPTPQPDAAAAPSPIKTPASVGVETDPALTQSQIAATLRNASLDSATVITPAPETARLPLQPAQKPVSRNTRMLVIGAGLLVLILLAVWLLIPRTVPVEITTTPVGATVRMKNTNQQCVTPHCNLKLRPGRYEIEIQLKGYEPKTQTLSVSPKGPNSISVALVVPPSPPVPPPVAAKPARILIRGWNRGSEVFLDGKSLGTVGKQATFSAAMAAGEHEIKVVDKAGKSGTIRRYFASGESAALAKKDFAVGPPPLPPPPPSSSEEKDWLQVKDSGSAEELAKFRARYPDGAHHGEVEAKLDDLYWNQAKQANSAEEYTRYLNEHPDGMHRDEAKAGMDDLAWNSAEHSNTLQGFQDYLAQHSQGRHAGEARKMVETLKFQTASSSDNETLLESFLRDYPSGDRHAQIYKRLDDVVWQKTNKNDLTSLQAYSARFPDGRHMNEARSDLDKVTAPKPFKPATPVINDKVVILDVIAQYNRAYNDRNIDELRRIWPSMDKKQIAAQRDFFKTVSSVTSSYRVDQEPQITGEEATVVITQVVDYVVQGRREKPLSGTRTVRLRRIPGAPGVWKIDSMSGN